MSSLNDACFMASQVIHLATKNALFLHIQPLALVAYSLVLLKRRGKLYSLGPLLVFENGIMITVGSIIMSFQGMINLAKDNQSDLCY